MPELATGLISTQTHVKLTIFEQRIMDKFVIGRTRNRKFVKSQQAYRRTTSEGEKKKKIKKTSLCDLCENFVGGHYETLQATRLF